MNQQTRQSGQARESGMVHRIGKWARMLSAPVVVALGLQGAPVQSQTVYFHNDTSGSPIAATDESGNLLWRESYRPYGERLLKPSAANTQWFHGKQLDPDTGMEDFGARNYDPVLGRFLSIDPVEFSDKNIHSFNRYGYGNNNPLKYKDPDGRIAETPWDVFNVAMGFVSLAANLSTGNLAGAALDVAGLAVDITATVVPGAPGGAATAINAARMAERATEVTATVTKVGDRAANATGAYRKYTPGGSFSKKTKEEVAARAGNKCEYCGVNTIAAKKSERGVTPPKNEAQTDHIVPKSEGGTNGPDNAAHACRECNRDLSNTIKPNPRGE
jgi:RHS repeat-associated protein